MGTKSYEIDRQGKISIYPSLNDPGRKGPGSRMKLIKTLAALLRGKR